MTIRNFKSINSLTFKDIQETLILVGKNNVGKSPIIDASNLLEMKTVVRNLDNGYSIDIYEASNSMKSIYILSLLQAYIALEERSMNTKPI